MSGFVRAFVGLGSNQNNPSKQILDGFHQIENTKGIKSLVRSSLYESDPVGYHDQPQFVNAVCSFDTSLQPEDLLRQLHYIEDQAGRDRSGPRWGPRSLDLDLLLHGESVLDLETLILPHPRMHERAFVLYPLQEIEPNMVIPGHGTIDSLAANCVDQRCVVIRPNQSL